MTLRHERHGSEDLVDSEFTHIDKSKQDLITQSDRAPLSSDKGLLWVDWAASKFYVRNPNSGTWTAV